MEYSLKITLEYHLIVNVLIQGVVLIENGLYEPQVLVIEEQDVLL